MEVTVDAEGVIVRGNANIGRCFTSNTPATSLLNTVIGRGQHKHGADGKDSSIDVPLGTVVKDAESGRSR